MHKQRDTQNNIELESIRLAKSFLADDRNAFNKLILLHKRSVFNLCYRFLGDYDDADDCAQEVFIKVSRSLKSFRFESSFSTWLYRITVNTCKNRLNSLEYRLKSRRVRIDAARHMDNESKQIDIEDKSPSPATELIRKEIDRLIQGAINALPAKQKLVVVLRDIEGKSYEEIVEITGFKLGTVKSKLSRARQQLKEALEGKI
ncbi:MAG: sigma-70 family RNA polymerase sigma factor [Candidatus Latescibacteria bacterium]|nr:sigma-70 family RNA polymerase sigma factor [Candidatus Latescibacterota bacterium]NIO57344.1 sigma-70 family RNA polymerase sigma factor [Candidatus Latescibacterota bacterium]